jgi:hypothetical protein
MIQRPFVTKVFFLNIAFMTDSYTQIINIDKTLFSWTLKKKTTLSALFLGRIRPFSAFTVFKFGLLPLTGIIIRASSVGLVFSAFFGFGLLLFLRSAFVFSASLWVTWFIKYTHCL